MRARIAIGLCLAMLVAWSFAERWDVLAGSPFPLGIDGYFYPIEVRSLLEHGTLAWPASPLALWWMAPFAAVTDPIVGAKLAAAVGGALVALPAYGLGARIGRGRAAGLVAAAVATLSAGSAYLSIEYVKQGIGLTVGLAALLAIARAAERPTRARLAVAAGAVVATLLAHKLAAVLVVVVGGAIAIEEARGRGVLRGRRLLYVTGAVVAGAGVLALLGVIAPQRFASSGDVALAGKLVTSHARWDGAALVGRHQVLVFDHEVIVGALAALAAGAVLIAARPARPSGARAAAWAFIVVGILLALPWLAVTDAQGLGYRVRIAAFVPLAMSAAVIAGALPARARGDVAAVLAVLLLLVPRDRSDGRVLAHPALVASALALTDHVPTGATLIVPERHVEFMIAWYTRAPVAARPESVPYAQRARVLLPLSRASEHFPLGEALDAARAEPGLDPPLGLHPRHRDGFVLVTEPTWDFIVSQLPERSRQHYLRWPTI